MVRVNADGRWPDPRLRAVNSVIVGLSDQEIFSVARFAASLPESWLLEYHQDCDGVASALLLPECDQDIALLFHREAGFLHLEAIHGDDHEHVASAQRIEPLFPTARTYVHTRGWAGRSPPENEPLPGDDRG